MHHVQDCSRVLKVRRGLVVSTVLFPPTSLKYRVIKTLGLCSCGKEKKNESPYFSHNNPKISASNSLYFGSYNRKCTYFRFLRGYFTSFPKISMFCALISKLSASFGKIIYASYSKLSKVLKISIRPSHGS